MNSEAKPVRKFYERESGNHQASLGKRQQQMLLLVLVVIGVGTLMGTTAPPVL